MAQLAGFPRLGYIGLGNKIKAFSLIISLVALLGHAEFGHGFSVPAANNPQATAGAQAGNAFVLYNPDVAEYSSPLQVIGDQNGSSPTIRVAAPTYANIQIQVIDSPWKNVAVAVMQQQASGPRIIVARESYLTRAARLESSEETARDALRNVSLQLSSGLLRGEAGIEMAVLASLLLALAVFSAYDRRPKVQVLIC
ncbi:MAG: hypothetical protein A2722_04585 [Candidatus Doudnabacteria bacterium RIFCSPHIGHO2_01_FULL_50_11]|uniref:Uncharacterized protein n=1 Tax=Candidatus Doudnabacteria bacterium RIFCSPHIGHO2_01_FULL_50_11 TaxID=1817828 RepID=A0A1F5PIV6_9BACT|nr:MAG: hypothetical protein A2722_04585 [Candidatus Doudnabacteria bacterium RIFCSPHIGHO2_01_FULL_50_11]HLC45180.1 hypothetical protein [Patescibacteria group bacterium]